MPLLIVQAEALGNPAMIQVLVSVTTDNGAPATGLQTDDFRIMLVMSSNPLAPQITLLPSIKSGLPGFYLIDCAPPAQLQWAYWPETPYFVEVAVGRGEDQGQALATVDPKYARS